MKIRSIFINLEEKRLRAGWRLVFFFSIYFLALSFAGVLALLIGYQVDLTDPVNLLTNQVLAAGAALAAIYIARRFVDARSFSSLGFNRRHLWQDIWAGFLIAGALMALIFLIFVVFGWLSFQGFIWQQESLMVWGYRLLVMLIFFALVGFIEETMFRGYLLLNIEAGLGTSWGISISGVIFALFHFSNPEGQGLAPMIGLLGAGILFGVAFITTRSLWLPIGLHIGFNFFENTVFGFPVSGLQIPGLINHTIEGPVLWTGGAFGPEAGLVLLPGLVLATIAVSAYARRRNAGPPGPSE